MRKACLVLMFAVLWSSLENYAYAYIDPGAGSMLIQALLAALAAVSVSVGIFWRRLKGFLSRLRGGNSTKANQDEER